MTPLKHDTPDERAQPDVRDWAEGECDPIPGRTMPRLRVVERDYVNLYNRFLSLDALFRQDGFSGNGVHISIAEFSDKLHQSPVGGMPDPWKTRCVAWNGRKYPAMKDALDAANVLLSLAPEANGEVCYAAFKHEEERTGVPLIQLAEGLRDIRMTFGDLTRQPRRTLVSPCWTGLPLENEPTPPGA